MRESIRVAGRCLARSWSTGRRRENLLGVVHGPRENHVSAPRVDGCSTRVAGRCRLRPYCFGRPRACKIPQEAERRSCRASRGAAGRPRLTPVNYTARAERLIDDLHEHYRRKGWIEASIALDRALQEAERRTGVDPSSGLSAPRPYSGLASAGEKWVKVRPYWVAYVATTPALILAVFHESADIPSRYPP